MFRVNEDHHDVTCPETRFKGITEILARPNFKLVARGPGVAFC